MSYQSFLKDLHQAVKSVECEKVSKILLQYPKYLNQPGIEKELESILKRAVKSNNLRLVELLIKNNNLILNLYSMVPTIFVNRSTRKDMLLLFIKYGLEVGSQNESCQNLLHLFVLKFVEEEDADAVDIVDILINFGISVNDIDDRGWTPLFYAISKRNIKLVSHLIKKEANVNHKNKAELTPLYISISHKDKDIVNLLVSNGADVNAELSEGRNILHFSSESHEVGDLKCEDHQEIVQLLIEKGADVRAKSKYGMTPFEQLPHFIYPAVIVPCASMILKEYSKLHFENIPTHVSEIWSRGEVEYFENCKRELNHLSNFKFYASFTYYSVLKMSKNIKKLASLVKNKEFVSKFHMSFSEVFYFKDDLRRILEDAEKVRDEFEEVVSRLDSTFGDFLPDIVIRKLAYNLRLEDLLLE